MGDDGAWASLRSLQGRCASWLAARPPAHRQPTPPPLTPFSFPQCIPTGSYGCDTWDSAMSCCAGLATPGAICKDEGQAVGVCRLP